MARRKRNKNGWNYRIICRLWHFKEPWFTTSYGVHEVYYTDNKPTSFTESEVSPGGESELDFWRSTAAYTEAFQKPILYFDTEKNEFVDKPKL